MTNEKKYISVQAQKTSKLGETRENMDTFMDWLPLIVAVTGLTKHMIHSKYPQQAMKN